MTPVGELTVLGARPYEEVRALCHAVKRRIWPFDEAVANAVGQMAGAIDRPAVLVPIPSHGGTATYTFALAGALCVEAAKKGIECTVADILVCKPHPSLCEEKHKDEGRPEDIAIEMFLKSSEPIERIVRGRQVFLVDNVVDTGKTACAALTALPADGILAVGDTGRWKDCRTAAKL